MTTLYTTARGYTHFVAATKTFTGGCLSGISVDWAVYYCTSADAQAAAKRIAGVTVDATRNPVAFSNIAVTAL